MLPVRLVMTGRSSSPHWLRLLHDWQAIGGAGYRGEVDSDRPSMTTHNRKASNFLTNNLKYYN